jgi:hypothetical protein
VRLLALFIGAAAMAACTPSTDPAIPAPIGSSPVPGGRIEVGVLGEPETLDPYASEASDLTYALAAPVFPMPFRAGPDGEVEPELASSLDVSGRTARMVLAPLTWSNDRPISARDVVASINRATSPSGFATIDSARVVGPGKIEMKGDIANWTETLSRGAFVMPRGKLNGGNLSGGSFRFSAYEPGRSLTYAPNKSAALAPLLDRIRVDFVQSTDLLIRLLDEGKLDVAAIPMSVNLDDRLDEIGLAYEERIGDERIVLRFAPDRVARPVASAVLDEIDTRRIFASFIRDDGTPLVRSGVTGGDAPDQLSIAAPDGDELLSLIQRAVQLDLERAGMEVDLITAPVSTIYGSWQLNPEADVLLVRTLATGESRSEWPLASVATFMARSDEVHGLAVNPSLEGPLWDAERWWIGPSI